MAQRTTENSVNDALATLESVIRLDAEATTGDLDLLVRINKNATGRYSMMADAAGGLEADSDYLEDAEVTKYIKQVDELDERVDDLEKIVKELEEWTGELEIKVRRLTSKR